MKLFRTIYAWMESKVHSKDAPFILGAFFFVEAFFLIPASPVLVFYCSKRRESALRFALIATLCSVTGGLIGYLIGYTLWHTIGPQIMHNSVINFFVSADNIAYFCELYTRNAWTAIIIASFFPIPYKAATITAGFCNIALAPFIFGSLIARSLRFFLIATIILIWGRRMKDFIDRYFTILVGCALVIVVIGIWMIIRRNS